MPNATIKNYLDVLKTIRGGCKFRTAQFHSVKAASKIMNMFTAVLVRVMTAIAKVKQYESLQITPFLLNNNNKSRRCRKKQRRIMCTQRSFVYNAI